MTVSSGRAELEAKTSLWVLAMRIGNLEAFTGPGLKQFGLVISRRQRVLLCFRVTFGKVAGLNKCLHLFY